MQQKLCGLDELKDYGEYLFNYLGLELTNYGRE